MISLVKRYAYTDGYLNSDRFQDCRNHLEYQDTTALDMGKGNSLITAA